MKPKYMRNLTQSLILNALQYRKSKHEEDEEELLSKKAKKKGLEM